MSETTNRRHWSELTPLAEWLVRTLAPACVEVVIAGSYRRRRESVGDLEIVVLPIWTAPPPCVDLFGDPSTEYPPEHPQLDSVLAALVGGGHLIKGHADGNLYKSFIVGHDEIDGDPLRFTGQKIDMFIATEMNFDNILAIRTGPREFSQRIVTPRDKGGRNMPAGMYQAGGALTSYGTVVPCRSERDFFAAINHAYVEPEARI